MRTLYDIVHPADVHFFRHAIAAQLEREDEVLVTSRDKDVTIELLDQLGIQHRVLTKQGRGPTGLFAELIQRDWRLLKVAREFRPHILVSNNSPCAAHVARMLRRPSLIFDDTEIHRFNQFLYYPFVTEVHSPRCYTKQLGQKHIIYDSYHALAYLHPAKFSPEWQRLPGHPQNESGRKRVVVRFVSHSAIHDVGATGLSDTHKRDLIKALSEHAEVLISAEGPLPLDLEARRVKLPSLDIHHLLGLSDLIIGESATMCAEAAALGTPAIYIDNQTRGYMDELKERYGLCFHFSPHDLPAAIDQACAILGRQHPREAFRPAHQRMLAENIDASDYQIEQIDRLTQGHRSLSADQ